MEQPNKLMTWNEMVKEYPDRWVIVQQTKGDVTNIEEGFVKFVATDDEVSDIWIQCRKAGLGYKKDRTTVEPFMGIIDGVNFSITVEEVLKDES